MENVVSHWRDRPVLVTGASGFLGGWLVRDLVEAGAEVHCLVRDRNPAAMLFESRNRIRESYGDVCDQVLLERVLNEGRITTVFHLAAQTIVGVASGNPVSTFDSNIRGTWSLLEACRRSPTVRSIVVASSDKAYGDQTKLPYQEDMPLNAVFPYDVSKACADMIAVSYARTFGLPVAVTRCGNFYGGGDLNWNRIVPGTIRSILRGEVPIIRSNGKMVRDYFYVRDGAKAYMELAHQLASRDDLNGEVFNFSSDSPLSVIDLVDRIGGVMGKSMAPKIENAANHEIGFQALDSSKAKSMLKWVPGFGLDEGLRQTVDWYTNFFDGQDS